MTTVNLGQADALHQQMAAEQTDAFGEHFRGLLKVAQRNLTDAAPRDTGEFAESIAPYGAAGPDSVADAYQGGRLHGDAEVGAALEGWEPGQPAGHASADPAAARLNAGSSKKAKAGWVQQAVRTAQLEVMD